MNKFLLEVQMGVNATAVVVLDEQYKEFKNAIIVKANVKDNVLYLTENGSPILNKKLKEKAKLADIVYLVIYGIDKVNNDTQERFLGLVKDREFEGFALPKNCVIVFSVTSKDNLKKIIPDLYHFCVNAID